MDEQELQARVIAIQRLLNDNSDKFVTQAEYDAVVEDAFIEVKREARIHAAIVASNRRGY